MSDKISFTNDLFDVLNYLYELWDDSNEVRISQQEIADKIGLSRVSVNRMIKKLKENDYLTYVSIK